MALVIKSWSIKSQPAPGEPHVRVVARESGFWSFILSLLGIDATTTLEVSSTRIEFEHGSLSGFIRRMTPFGHVSSTFYGRHKPWKTALFILAVCFSIGSAIGKAWALLAFLLIGLIGAGLYYFLNRELTFGFIEDSGFAGAITFKRSVIEGQEINEEQLRKMIAVIEHQIKRQSAPLENIDIGGQPGNERFAAPAPTSLKEVFGGVAPPPVPTAPKAPPPAAPQAPAQAAPRSHCPQCNQPCTAADRFCGHCGHTL